jgi:hypothetical protein
MTMLTSTPSSSIYSACARVPGALDFALPRSQPVQSPSQLRVHFADRGDDVGGLARGVLAIEGRAGEAAQDVDGARVLSGVAAVDRHGA